MTDTATSTPSAPAAPPPSGPDTPATPAAPAASSEGSLLASVQALDTQAAPAVGEHDWLPEKFRVMVDDKLDEGASARKLAESYKALEAHKGALPQVPATPDDYKIAEIKGADGKPIDAELVDGFTSDPLFKAFAADAHAQGLTNEQMQFVVERYMSLAPKLIAADQQISRDEASAELSALWKDEQTFNANIKGALKAVTGFGAEAADVPGSRARLQEKFGNDPDFLAFAATVAGEMREDALTAQPGLAAGDGDLEALMKSPAYWDPKHADHTRIKAQVDAHFTRKHGQKRR